MPFPAVSKSAEWIATWQKITAPVMWVLADDSHIRKWATVTDDEWERRKGAFANFRFERVADAGHMPHHDQPSVVAELIEHFVRLGHSGGVSGR